MRQCWTNIWRNLRRRPEGLKRMIRLWSSVWIFWQRQKCLSDNWRNLGRWPEGSMIMIVLWSETVYWLIGFVIFQVPWCVTHRSMLWLNRGKHKHFPCVLDLLKYMYMVYIVAPNVYFKATNHLLKPNTINNTKRTQIFGCKSNNLVCNGSRFFQATLL